MKIIFNVPDEKALAAILKKIAADKKNTLKKETALYENGGILQSIDRK